jgi:hypothetical protein
MWKLDDDILSCDVRNKFPVRVLQNDLGISDGLPVSEHCQLLLVLPCLTAVGVLIKLMLLRLPTPHYMIV